MAYLWVGLGSALGGMARFWCYGFMARSVGAGFPWGTLLVNVAGSLIIGFFATLTVPGGKFEVPMTARQFVMSGICGGFTTFSTFSLETLYLARDGEWTKSGFNIVVSLAFCLGGVWGGHNAALMIQKG